MGNFEEVWVVWQWTVKSADAQGCGRTLRQMEIRNCRKSRNRTTEPIRNEILKGFPPSEALGDVI